MQIGDKIGKFTVVGIMPLNRKDWVVAQCDCKGPEIFIKIKDLFIMKRCGFEDCKRNETRIRRKVM